MRPLAWRAVGVPRARLMSCSGLRASNQLRYASACPAPSTHPRQTASAVVPGHPREGHRRPESNQTCDEGRPPWCSLDGLVAVLAPPRPRLWQTHSSPGNRGVSAFTRPLHASTHLVRALLELTHRCKHGSTRRVVLAKQVDVSIRTGGPKANSEARQRTTKAPL